MTSQTGISLHPIIYRDYLRDIPDENKTVPDRYIWPEATKFYREILHDRERLSVFCDQLEGNVALMENKDGYYYKRICRLLFQARAFLRDTVSFKEADENILPRQQYITEDGINYVICGGSSISDNKLRTYSFFLRNKDKDKRTRYI